MKRFQAQHRSLGLVMVIAIKKRTRTALVANKFGELSWVNLDALKVTEKWI